MKQLLGVLFFICGIFFALYVGVYLCLWGGAVSMFVGLSKGLFWTFIWGLIKWGIAGLCGWITLFIFSAIAASFFD